MDPRLPLAGMIAIESESSMGSLHVLFAKYFNSCMIPATLGSVLRIGPLVMVIDTLSPSFVA